MTNYYRYLPVSEEDEKWGLCVLNAGCSSISASDTYPHATHPQHHYFNWNNGRVLHEYQVIYITKGEGIFESASYPQTTIKEGFVILLFPGEWHRYKPNKNTGWDEYWIGFTGDVADNLVTNKFFHRETPVLPIGFHENIMNLLSEIIDKTRQEKAGYQPSISGAVLHLLGKIYSISRQSIFNKEDMVELVVNKARLIFRENIDKDIAVEKVAADLQVGYSWFRKVFKTYTGMAPGQYLIQLKIEKSKELLLDQKKSIKEVAYDLHFDSNFYFSKLFKEKTGLTPAQFRKRSGVV